MRKIVSFTLVILLTSILPALALENATEDDFLPAFESPGENFNSQEGPAAGNKFQGHHGRNGYQKQEYQGHKRKGQFLNWIKTEMPDLAAELKKLQQESPDVYRSFSRQLHKNASQLLKNRNLGNNESAKDIVKKLLKNELKSLKLADQCKKSEDIAEQESLKQKLKIILDETFDLKEEIQQQVIQNMNKRLEELKELIAKRKGLKEQIVSERLDEITSNDKVLKW